MLLRRLCRLNSSRCCGLHTSMAHRRQRRHRLPPHDRVVRRRVRGLNRRVGNLLCLLLDHRGLPSLLIQFKPPHLNLHRFVCIPLVLNHRMRRGGSRRMISCLPRQNSSPTTTGTVNSPSPSSGISSKTTSPQGYHPRARVHIPVNSPRKRLSRGVVRRRVSWEVGGRTMFRWRIGRGIIGMRVLTGLVVVGWGWGDIKDIGQKFDPWGFCYHRFLRTSYYLGGCRHQVVSLLSCLWYSYQLHVNMPEQRILQITVRRRRKRNERESDGQAVSVCAEFPFRRRSRNLPCRSQKFVSLSPFCPRSNGNGADCDCLRRHGRYSTPPKYSKDN